MRAKERGKGKGLFFLSLLLALLLFLFYASLSPEEPTKPHPSEDVGHTPLPSPPSAPTHSTSHGRLEPLQRQPLTVQGADSDPLDAAISRHLLLSYYRLLLHNETVVDDEEEDAAGGKGVAQADRLLLHVEPPRVVYLAARHNGHLLAHVWSEPEELHSFIPGQEKADDEAGGATSQATLLDSLRHAVHQLYVKLEKTQNAKALQTLEVSLAEPNDTGTPLDIRRPAQRGKLFANTHRGLAALFLQLPANAHASAKTLSAKVGPTWVTATDRRHDKALLWVVKKVWARQLGDRAAARAGLNSDTAQLNAIAGLGLTARLLLMRRQLLLIFPGAQLHTAQTYVAPTPAVLTQELAAKNDMYTDAEAAQRLGPPPRRPPQALRLFRGALRVPMGAVTPTAMEALILGCEAWLARNVDDNGQMLYKFWPSPVKTPEANNMIRQWMATVSLGRIARRYEDDGLPRDIVEGAWERAARNIDYNLAMYYHETTNADSTNGGAPLGLIELDGKVKLGAVALAALALLEHRDAASPRFLRVRQALDRTVMRLFDADEGSFVTFFRPAGRNDNQNFYPGEALTYWAERVQRGDGDGGGDLSQHFMRAARYYRSWHLAQRDPAFVPWHTQACYLRYMQLEGQAAEAAEAAEAAWLRDWIFEMNDWLLQQMLQGANHVPYSDMVGRFYADGDVFGPPHASSTGVYLEGLADALALARRVGDVPRANRYRDAILLGLRSVIQLQFTADTLWYVPRQAWRKAAGALRTTVYHNEVRVDNQQHLLLALLRLRRRLTADDYALAASLEDAPTVDSGRVLRRGDGQRN